MKYIITCFLIVFCGGLQAQKQPKPEKFAQHIDTGDLKTHLFNIASPEMEGRETATDGQKKAAGYIENHFKSLGLKGGWNGGYQQPFPVMRDSLVKAAMNVAGEELKHDTDFAVSQNSGFNISMTAGEILFVGFGSSDSANNDYQDQNAMGKIVLVIPPPAAGAKENKHNGLQQGIQQLREAAKRNGAAALLIMDARFPRTPSPVYGPMYVNDYRKDELPNTFFISDSVAEKIMGNDFKDVISKLSDTRPTPKTYAVNVTIELNKYREQLESTNVIGVLEGTSKKDEAVIITSHYDHMGKKDSVIFYGADDDGSGTVTILELSQAFAKAAEAGMRPKRSVIFMTVSGEEKGLWGSDYYSDHPTFPLAKTSVNVNIDMIGRIESGRSRPDTLKYVYVVGDDKLSSDLRPISEGVNKKYFNFTLDYKFNDPKDPQRIFYRSDHYNFAKHGVPAIFYFNGLHDDYHRPTDTPDKINYELLSKRAQLIFYTTWEFANRNEMLKRDIPLEQVGVR